MALNTVNLTFTEQDSGGGATTGPVVISPTSLVTAAGQTVVSQAPIIRQFSGGTVTVTLVATDNAGTSPAAGFWAYNIQLPGQAVPALYLVAFANGANQQFSNLTPVVAQTTYGPAASTGFTNPMTTLGDIIYESAAPAAARLAGSTSAVKNFLTQTGTGSVSAAPAWGTIAPSDLAATANEAGYAPLLLNPAVGMVWGYPWKFDVFSYGAKGDGIIVTDGAITSGTPNLACASSTPFKSSMVGHAIVVDAAGTSGAPLVTTISSFTDSGHVVLAANAGTTTTSSIVRTATDDLPAWKSAYAAAQGYTPGGAKVVFDPFLYGFAGAPTIGGATLGNAQLPLGTVAGTGEKQVIGFECNGGADATGLLHWLQTIPQFVGGFIMCLRNDGTVDATYGPSSVIGGPFSTYGAGSGSPAVFSNQLITIDRLGILLPYNGTYAGLDFWGVAEAHIVNAAVHAAAVVPSGGTLPSQGNPTVFSNFGWFGLRMPSEGNNALCIVENFSAEGVVNGFRPSEHCSFQSVRAINCYAGIVPYAGTTGVMPHSVLGAKATIENCVNALSGIGGTDGTTRIDISQLDVEGINNNVINDPGSQLQGYVGFRQFGTASVYAGGSTPQLRVVNLNQVSGHMASPPAVPATTVAAAPVYKDAVVVVHTGAGVTVSAITVDGTATSQTVAASSSSVPITVASGKTIALTYAGGTPTWDWWLS